MTDCKHEWSIDYDLDEVWAICIADKMCEAELTQVQINRILNAHEGYKSAVAELTAEDVELIRVCAKTLDSFDTWARQIILARSNYLRRLATRIETYAERVAGLGGKGGETKDKCLLCEGEGWYQEHHHDCSLSTGCVGECPIQVPCDCEAEGGGDE